MTSCLANLISCKVPHATASPHNGTPLLTTLPPCFPNPFPLTFLSLPPCFPRQAPRYPQSHQATAMSSSCPHPVPSYHLRGKVFEVVLPACRCQLQRLPSGLSTRCCSARTASFIHTRAQACTAPTHTHPPARHMLCFRKQQIRAAGPAVQPLPLRPPASVRLICRYPCDTRCSR